MKDSSIFQSKTGNLRDFVRHIRDCSDGTYPPIAPHLSTI